jgi:hypothetical protein
MADIQPMLKSAIALAILALPAIAAADCPAAVTTAIKQAFPADSIAGCKKDGDHFEVTFARKGIEVDVSSAGAILLIEETIAVKDLPAAVAKAFAARYAQAKPTGAEKMTKADKSVLYEVAFVSDKKHEATFRADGTFVELE